MPSSRPTSSTSPRRRRRGTWSVSWSRRTTGSSRGRCWRKSIRGPPPTMLTSAGGRGDPGGGGGGGRGGAWARVGEGVQIQIEIARRTLAAAEADQAKAKEALKLTEDEVEKGIDEAKAALAAAKADLVLAEQEYTRYTTLEKEMASTLRRAQQVTQERDAAKARRDLAVAKLAKAEAARRSRSRNALWKRPRRRPRRRPKASIWPRPATPRSGKSSC